MTYEERKAEAMSMTLEELIFNYHWAMDTAENRKATIISLQYLLDERHLQIEALYDTIQGLTDGRDKLKTEVKPEPISSVEVCQWKLRRKEWELEDMTTRLEVVTHDRDELVNDLHEYEDSADRMQEELYIAQKDRDRLEKELREIKSND